MTTSPGSMSTASSNDLCESRFLKQRKDLSTYDLMCIDETFIGLQSSALHFEFSWSNISNSARKAGVDKESINYKEIMNNE